MKFLKFYKNHSKLFHIKQIYIYIDGYILDIVLVYNIHKTFNNKIYKHFLI